jgi:hypothetical protein
MFDGATEVGDGDFMTALRAPNIGENTLAKVGRKRILTLTRLRGKVG